MGSIFRDEEQYNVESYWAHITSSRGRLVGGGNRPKIVHQLGTFTTPNWVCLGGRIGTAKKYVFSLAVLINNQEIYILLGGSTKTAKKTCNFLGSSALLPSKRAIFLAARLSRQVICFPWRISLAVWWPRN